MTSTETDRAPVALAPRHHEGRLLGHYDATVLYAIDGPDPAYVVRFSDGHEAGAYRRELRATCDNWELIDRLTPAA